MADREEKRKTHFFRVIGQTPDGEDKDTWLDLERLDYYRTKEAGGPDFIRTNYKLKWYEDDAGKVPNAERETTKIKIVPPDDDPDNPSLWFEVEVNDKIKIRDNDQIIYVHFDNSADNNGRKVKVRKIVHYDTTADEKYPDGGMIPAQDYKKIKSTKDTDQYVDHEIIEKRRFRDADQKYGTRYNVQPLIDASEPASRTYGEGEINPPWRLDPLQTIVNIKLRINYTWLVGKLSTLDNESYNAENGEGAIYEGKISGASGIGLTVIADGYVAFGSFTNNDDSTTPGFLRSNGATVLKGVSDGQGGITWTPVWVTPSEHDVIAISFANDTFFIAYVDGDNLFKIATTENGTSFTAGMNPLEGTDARGAGHIAWIKDVGYVASGSESVFEIFNEEFPALTEVDADDFVSAFSPNGVNWIAVSHGDGIYGGIGGSGAAHSSVAAGNGIFVACAAKKNIFSQDPVDTFDGDGNPVTVERPNYVIGSAAVAVSTNGTTWTLVELPGAVVRSNTELGDRGSTTQAVVWVKDSQADNGKGYFIATASESGGIELTTVAKMWKSENGMIWSLIKTQTKPAVPGAADAIWDVLSAIKKNQASTNVVQV